MRSLNHLYSTCAYILSFLFVILLPNTLAAQDELLKPVSRVYAITQTTIIQAPGRTLDKGTVVIRDGLIESVGKDIRVPSDAIVIKGDSMFVYAGFINGLSRAGVDKPDETKNQDKSKDPGDPLPAEAGVTPYIDVRDFLKKNDHALKDLRCRGFTAAHIVPQGVFLPGSGAVVLLGGEPSDKMFVRSNSCLYSEFSWNRGVYPSTVMGLMAKWRELYRQAQLAHAYEPVYAANKNGIPRPGADRILLSFYPVISKQMPVLFKAEHALDIQRALTLQRDLGIPSIIIAEMQEGWYLVDKLKASNAKVFLSLALPEKEKKEKEKEKGKEDKRDTKKISQDTLKKDPERIALEARKAECIQKHDSQAAVFYKAGVKFGFSALEVKSKDVKPNLKRMIDAGLSEEAALAALTIHAAEILGLADQMGTVDKGKIANLVITDKPYFDEKSAVRYVFVDGWLYENSKKKTEEPAPDEISGTWSFVTETPTPQGKVELKVVFKKENDQYTGWISGGNLPDNTQLTSVTQQGKKLRFVYSVMYDDQNKVEVAVDGTWEGSSFKGDMVVGQFGTFPIEGTKKPEW